jgi:hypothetical protein
MHIYHLTSRLLPVYTLQLLPFETKFSLWQRIFSYIGIVSICVSLMRRAIADLVGYFHDAFGEMRNRLIAAAENNVPVDIYAELGQLSMDVIGRSAFGMNVAASPDANGTRSLRECVNMYLRGEASQRTDPLLTVRELSRIVNAFCVNVVSYADRYVNTASNLRVSIISVKL